MIKWLLSSGLKPGSVKGSIYTTLIPITKANAGTEGVLEPRHDDELAAARRRAALLRPP